MITVRSLAWIFPLSVSVVAPALSGQGSDDLAMSSENHAIRQASFLTAAGTMASPAFATAYKLGLPTTGDVMLSDSYANISGVPDPAPTDSLFSDSFEE